MMKMDSEWREFADRHFHGMEGQIPKIQFEETKKTFYATFAHVLVKMRNEIGALSEDAGVAQLQSFMQEIQEFLIAHKNDGKKQAAAAPAAPGYKEAPDLKADRNMVFDLMHELKGAFERFVNDDKQDVPYVDAMMGVHNFHKLIIKDIADRAKMPRRARAEFYRMTADTYTKAINDLIIKEAQAAHA